MSENSPAAGENEIVVSVSFREENEKVLASSRPQLFFAGFSSFDSWVGKSPDLSEF